jgi:hypothetical protein
MRFIVIILFSFFSLPVTAQRKAVPDSSKVAYDSSSVRQRDFSSSSLTAYTKNEDFQYEKEVAQHPTWWDRFWDWVWRKYAELMNTAAGRATMTAIYWIVGISAVAFFLIKVTRMSRMNLFTASPANTIPYITETENIHTISFDEAIDNALQNGNYRLAIRLLYLQNLKVLSDKNIIAWQSNKTNYDYLHEIIEPNLQQLFKHITDVFEYAWYGHLTVDREDFDELKESIVKFKSRL